MGRYLVWDCGHDSRTDPDLFVLLPAHYDSWSCYMDSEDGRRKEADRGGRRRAAGQPACLLRRSLEAHCLMTWYVLDLIVDLIIYMHGFTLLTDSWSSQYHSNHVLPVPKDSLLG